MRRRHPGPIAPALAAVLGMVLLGGCMVGPDFVRPPPPDEAGYAAPALHGPTDDLAQRFSADATLPPDWWRLFASPVLDAQVERALAHSPTLAAATAALRQSEDALRAGQGAYWPQVELDAGATRERSAPAASGSSLPGSVFSVYTAGAGVRYAIDLFGRRARRTEALGAAVEVQRQQRHAAYLALTANVVQTTIACAAYEDQARLIDEALELQREQLRALQAQERGGTAGHASVLQQEAQIAATQATRAPLRQRLEQARHLLAVLEGASPGDWVPPALRLDELKLPHELPLSLSSALVRQRPDILAAEAQLHQASAEVGVATAALYPDISLGASYLDAGSRWNRLPAANGRFWSVGPSVTLPLFEGGALHYAERAAEEAHGQALAAYRQTVLEAFGQVADRLVAIAQDAELDRAEADALDAARRALALTRAQERAGLAAGVDRLGAEVQARVAAIARLQALALRHQDTVALYAALGGGWWNGAEAP